MYAFNLGLRFQNIVELSDDQIALWFSESERVTYRTVNSLANRVARLFIDRGISAGDVICLAGDKSVLTYASIIACLKIGAIYCMLDPGSPAERLRKILSRCLPRFVIGKDQFLAPLESTLSVIESRPLDATDLEQEANNYSDANLAETNHVTGADPAYIMFTSGSTGFPKGAVMTHRNVLNLIEWSQQTYSITSDDRVTNVNPLYFDNSVFDIYSSLFSGAQLVPFTKDEVQNPKALVDKVAAAGCSLWFSVPSLLIFLQTMRATDGKNLRSIRRFVFGGEGYPKAKLKQLYDLYADSSQFFNVYGPTECTCICSSYRLSEEDFADVQGLPPLGSIAENFSFLVVTEEQQAARPGEIGELCLGGPNVGLGYYNDPERTAAAFIQNPLHTRFRDIVYRTGDMVHVDEVNGMLHIHGRRDNQIKHMGYRIELEELESALHCLDYVSEAAALHTTQNGLSRIIAIVAARREFNDDQIRDDLGRILPAYMIPSVFYRESILPKNANGKVDRRELADRYAKGS